MGAYGISESEVESCFGCRSSSYFADADVVYVYNDDQSEMLKVRAKSMFKIQADPEVAPSTSKSKTPPPPTLKK